MAGPLIVSAELAAPEQAWLDALRTRHFPADRLQVGAHLTLFHALPPSVEAEVRDVLAELAKHAPPSAIVEAPYSMGRGVAFRIRSPALDQLRDTTAERFFGLLSAQDGAGWRAHVTVQNKVAPGEAKALLNRLAADFRPIATRVVALALHRYEGGPWTTLARYPFRG